MNLLIFPLISFSWQTTGPLYQLRGFPMPILEQARLMSAEVLQVELVVLDSEPVVVEEQLVGAVL